METDNRSSYFNGAEIREKIKELIGRSESSIQVAMAWFTDPEIFEAIEQALDRGVRVSLVIGENEDNDRLPFHQLESKGATVVRIAGRGRGVMHNKFAIIDDKYVLNGSYNWTLNAAKNNSENMDIVSDANTVAEYKRNMDMLLNGEMSETQGGDIVRTPPRREDTNEGNRTFSQRFDEALKAMVYAHFNAESERDYIAYGKERSEQYGGQPDAVGIELDAIQGNLNRLINEEQRDLLLMEVDTMRERYIVDINESATRRVREMTERREAEKAVYDQRIEEKKRSIDEEKEVEQNHMREIEAIEAKREQYEGDKAKLEEEYEPSKRNPWRILFKSLVALPLIGYLFFFYSSSTYILLHGEDDRKEQSYLAQSDTEDEIVENEVVGIYDPGALEKARKKSGTSLFFVILGALVPLYIGARPVFLKKTNGIGNNILILVFDFFVAWQVAEISYREAILLGQAATNEEWQFQFLFFDKNFYLVLMFGALPLWLYKGLVSSLNDDVNSENRLYLKRKFRKSSRVVDKKIKTCSDSLIEKERERGVVKDKIDMILKELGDIKMKRDELLQEAISKEAQLDKEISKERESILNIADRYSIGIKAGRVSHVWSLVSIFYSDFISGWTEYLYDLWAREIATKMQDQVQVVFENWKERNYDTVG